MKENDWQPRWVVCHSATRSVSLTAVSCPLRGRVAGSACLSCRFLVTSSLERDESGWCRTPDEPPRGDLLRRPARRPIAIQPESRPSWPLSLPVLVVPPAARAEDSAPSLAG